MDRSLPFGWSWTGVAAAVLLALLAAGPVRAEEELLHGGDLYLAGEDVAAPPSLARSLYQVGGNVDLKEAVPRNAHLAGFHVEAASLVGGDLYAAGALVELDATVIGDASIAAFRAELGKDDIVGGNLRVAARTVMLDGSIKGAALVAAERLVVNGVVEGDLRFVGRKLVFGPAARVNGILTAATPYKPSVPASVAAADRVRHETFAPSEFVERFGRSAGEAIGLRMPAWWMVAAAIGAFLLGLALLGVLVLGLAPDTVEGLREEAENHAWATLGYGLIGLATLLGLVPLAILTIVGAPLVPLIVIFVMVTTVFAYLLGAYVFAHRVFQSFGARHATMAGRLRTFIIGLLVLVLLNVLPFIGWLINALAVLVGIGAMEMRLIDRLGRRAARPASGAVSPV